MRILKFCTLLVISTIRFCEASQNFPQCPSTDKLEKTVQILTQQHLDNERILYALLKEFQAERAEKNRVKKEQLQRLIEDEEQEKQLMEFFENLPRYQRYTIFILEKTLPWIQKELLPIIKSIITQMLARKIVEAGLYGTDFVCGDVPEKLFPNRFGATIAFRPGEWLNLSSEQRETQSIVRELRRKNPEFKNAEKTVNNLKRERKQQEILFNMMDKETTFKDWKKRYDEEEKTKQSAIVRSEQNQDVD